jgi:hypothetical protein
MSDDKNYKELNWFVRLFTLGKTFSLKDFFDRFKKSIVEFMVIVFGILISFSVEKQGQKYDERAANIENLKSLSEELVNIKGYTEDYMSENEWVTSWFQGQYDRWEEDDDFVFIEIEQDSSVNIPLSMYFMHNPFNPPRIVFNAIKLDGTFRLLDTEIGRMVNNIYDGVDINYLMRNTDAVEQENVKEFKDRVTNIWARDLNNINTETSDFWLKNRRYIQSDRVAKHILYSRIQNWLVVSQQLQDYDGLLDQNIGVLDSALLAKEEEVEFLWWWF